MAETEFIIGDGDSTGRRTILRIPTAMEVAGGGLRRDGKRRNY